MCFNATAVGLSGGGIRNASFQPFSNHNCTIMRKWKGSCCPGCFIISQWRFSCGARLNISISQRRGYYNLVFHRNVWGLHFFNKESRPRPSRLFCQEEQAKYQLQNPFVCTLLAKVTNLSLSLPSLNSIVNNSLDPGFVAWWRFS